MVKIVIGNVNSTIKDIGPRLVPTIARALAVETPGYQFSPMYKSGNWDGMTRFFTPKTGKFPTGLLSNLLVTLKQEEVEYEIEDTRSEIEYTLPEEITLVDGNSNLVLRDYQYDSVKLALEATRGVINVATNGGKTEIACGIIQCILPSLKPNQRLVFFTHTKEIFTQSHKRIQERLRVKVGKIGAGIWEPEQITVVMIPTIQKYIKKPKTLPKSKKYSELLSNVSSLETSYRKTKDEAKRTGLKIKIEATRSEIATYEKEQWAKITENVKRTKDFLDSIAGFLGDEVHHASSDTWYKVFMSLDKAYYRFGLTGTVDEKEKINAMRLYGCTGRIIKKVSNDYLIEQGHSAKPTIYFLRPNAPAIDNVPYPVARTMGIIENRVRNKVFVDKILERAKTGKQCLIIVNETKHGKIVEDMLDGNGITLAFTHGDRSDRFREECLSELKDGSLRILIATSILDEGVDVSGINCIFLMAGGKSMRQVLQRIGRGLRKKADGSGVEVYDSLDYHNIHLVEHTQERYNTYKSEKFEIQKL